MLNLRSKNPFSQSEKADKSLCPAQVSPFFQPGDSSIRHLLERGQPRHDVISLCALHFLGGNPVLNDVDVVAHILDGGNVAAYGKEYHPDPADQRPEIDHFPESGIFNPAPLPIYHLFLRNPLDVRPALQDRILLHMVRKFKSFRGLVKFIYRRRSDAILSGCICVEVRLLGFGFVWHYWPPFFLVFIREMSSAIAAVPSPPGIDMLSPSLAA